MILAMMVFVGGLSTGALAQQVPEQEKQPLTPEERAAKITEKMTESLGLDESQKDKVYAINLDAARQLETYRQEMKAAREAFREKRKALMSAKAEELKAVLSEEQFHRFELQRERYIGRKEGRRQMMRRQRNVPPPNGNRPE